MTKKKELTDEELDELDGFLQTEYDHTIYNELTGDAYYKCDDEYALDFFRLLYSQIDFIKENKHKPLFVIRSLKKLDLNETELHILCEKLLIFFSKSKTKDEQLKVCCREIKKIDDEHNEKIYAGIYKRKEMKKNAVRKDILSDIEELPDAQTRLEYLQKKLIDYERDSTQISQLADQIDESSYYSQLTKEIQKAEALVELEQKGETTNIDEELKTNLTARQWSIAVRFFINHYGLREIDTIAFARLLAVLNGGKNLQNFRTELGNERNLITAKTREKAKEIADLYRHCDLPKIADEIERASSRIKPNNL